MVVDIALGVLDAHQIIFGYDHVGGQRYLTSFGFLVQVEKEGAIVRVAV